MLTSKLDLTRAKNERLHAYSSERQALPTRAQLDDIDAEKRDIEMSATPKGKDKIPQLTILLLKSR